METLTIIYNHTVYFHNEHMDSYVQSIVIIYDAAGMSRRHHVLRPFFFFAYKARFREVTPFPYKCKVNNFLELNEEDFTWPKVKQPIGLIQGQFNTTRTTTSAYDQFQYYFPKR
jgi:hypothetical protein